MAKPTPMLVATIIAALTFSSSSLAATRGARPHSRQPRRLLTGAMMLLGGS
jgi:hypothetical protein